MLGHRSSERRVGRGAARVAIVGTALVAFVVGAAGAGPTEAAWRDPVHAQTTVTAATIPPATVASCAYGAGLGSWTATFTLTGLSTGAVVRYRLFEPGSTTSVIASGSVAATGATLAVPVSQGALLGRWRVEFEVVRGTWTSAVSVGHVVTLAGLLGSCGPGA